jgi:hypothetical protein
VRPHQPLPRQACWRSDRRPRLSFPVDVMMSLKHEAVGMPSLHCSQASVPCSTSSVFHSLPPVRPSLPWRSTDDQQHRTCWPALIHVRDPLSLAELPNIAPGVLQAFLDCRRLIFADGLLCDASVHIRVCGGQAQSSDQAIPLEIGDRRSP